MVELLKCPPIGADLTPGMVNIFKLLNFQHRGQWIKSPQLAKEAKYTTGGSCAKLRKDIELMNIGHHIPIISGPLGFKMADKPEELKAYAQNLRDRAYAELRRVKSLEETAERMLTDPAYRGKIRL